MMINLNLQQKIDGSEHRSQTRFPAAYPSALRIYIFLEDIVEQTNKRVKDSVSLYSSL